MSAIEELIQAEGETLIPDPGAAARNLHGLRQLLRDGDSLPPGLAEGLPAAMGGPSAVWTHWAVISTLLLGGATGAYLSFDAEDGSGAEVAVLKVSGAALENRQDEARPPDAGSEQIEARGPAEVMPESRANATEVSPAPVKSRAKARPKRRRVGSQPKKIDPRRPQLNSSRPSVTVEAAQPQSSEVQVLDRLAPERSPKVQAPPAPEGAKAEGTGEGVSTFDRELALLTAAKAAFDDGQFRRARRLLRRHQRRFPGGVFRVEADALSTILACRASSEPGRRAALFVEHADRHPQDASLPRVRRACGVKKSGARVR